MKPENQFLSALSGADRVHLMQVSRRVQVAQRFSFYEPGGRPEAIYFPETGMASELVRMSDGRAIDGSPVGVDGFIGVPAILGVDRSFHHCVMQVPGSVLRVPTETVRALFENSPGFRSLTLQLVHARFVQATQCAACNLLHTMDQRLARWLLCARRHTSADSFQVTQEFISEMVGANRSTITTALGAFQRAGFVRFERGLVTIVDAPKLMTASCECYEVICAALDRIGPGMPR